MQFNDTDLGSTFPKQKLSYRQKTNKWAAQCVNYGASKDIFNSSPVRKSVLHKQINYDLLNGKLHMEDLKALLNPTNIKDPTSAEVPDNIQHYPIMNSKLRVLDGEESARIFDYRVVVTNPEAISDIERAKRAAIVQRLQEEIANSAQSEEEFQQRMQELFDYFVYEYQDIREIKANALVNHYNKEYNFRNLFNQGFVDAKAVGEEIYQCAIVKGEPMVFKLNPRDVRIYRSGYSNKIEDADMIVIEEYWSRGRIYDTFHESLTDKDVEYIEGLGDTDNDIVDAYGNYSGQEPAFPITGTDVLTVDDKGEIISVPRKDLEQGLGATLFDEQLTELPFDFEGNVKVSQVFWKTRRLIKSVKSYDPETGEEVYNLYPETYQINKDLGETEEKYWINEAWKGVKIADKIYVDLGPCPVQRNSIANPSKCDFGIIGSIYNINNDQPFSMVDMMKPYNYYYDVIYDRLNQMIARNPGKVLRLDLAKKPSTWGMEEWYRVLKTYGIAVENSFEEGKVGMAKGKLAGAMNNASSGVIDAELGQSISTLIQTLEFIKQDMSDVVGISRQREGQISNRETVGGVERATLQSSHITEWLFTIHDDVKKRVIECFLDYAKAAIKGKNKKFQYILPDFTIKSIDIDGDEFNECSYGLVVDNSNQAQELSNNLPMIIQAGLQNRMLTLSTVMKIYNSNSLAEKQRMIERDERKMMEQQQEMQQQQLQAQQQQAEMEQQAAMAKMEHEAAMNSENNETKIIVAQIQANAKQTPVEDTTNQEMSEEARAKLEESIREFNLKHELDRDKLNFEKDKASTDASIKRQQLNKRSSAS